MTYPVDTAVGLCRLLVFPSDFDPPPPLRFELLVTLGELWAAARAAPCPVPPLFFIGLGIFSTTWLQYNTFLCKLRTVLMFFRKKILIIQICQGVRAQ